MDESELQWARAGEAIRRRRAEMGLAIKVVAKRAGMSPNTWIKLETHHEELSALKEADMEKVLGWDTGEIRRIARGASPPTAASPAPKQNGKPVVLNGDDPDRLDIHGLPDDYQILARSMVDDMRQLAEERVLGR